jgi:hypothetical protein
MVSGSLDYFNGRAILKKIAFDILICLSPKGKLANAGDYYG